MLNDFQTDSAFWHYYSWCQEMEALREEQEQELENLNNNNTTKDSFND